MAGGCARCRCKNKLPFDYLSVVPNDELSLNLSGRQVNRGMEGLVVDVATGDGGRFSIHSLAYAPQGIDGHGGPKCESGADED